MLSLPLIACKASMLSVLWENESFACHMHLLAGLACDSYPCKQSKQSPGGLILGHRACRLMDVQSFRVQNSHSGLVLTVKSMSQVIAS
jgi:hypothetical protein